LKPKAKVRFFRVEAHCRCFFTARKKSEPEFAPTRGFPRLDAHQRCDVNAKFPTTGFQFDTEIDAELAGGAAELIFFRRTLSFSPYRAYVQKLGPGNDRSFSLTGASSARSIERLSRFLDGSNV
jgi:hypothetical protein